MLETILAIIAWVAVAGFTIVFFLVSPSLFLMLKALVTKNIRWPGPPDFDSQSTEYRQAQLMGTPYRPKPLFQGFLSNVLGILGTLFLMVMFIFILIPQISKIGSGKLIAYIVFQVLTIMAGIFWIKPTLRSRKHFITWFVRK